MFADVPAESPAGAAPRLPEPRGPVSAALVARLSGPPAHVAAPDVGAVDPLVDDDLHLALYCCYELHYRGFAGVVPEWEWEPGLLGARRVLEQAFLDALREDVAGELAHPVEPGDVPARLDALVAGAGGPPLSARVEREGHLEQVRELAVHRSPYQLKEADPHTWALPRLWGAPKSAIVAIQHDEYGAGAPGVSHAELFADTMVALGLDPAYGAYVDDVPGVTLATVNLMTMFGLHRRWRGALVGHLAVFEMTSVVPMGRYARALTRLGLAPAARRFYDAHVEADAWHEVLARDTLAGGLALQEPALAPDIVFGAASLLAAEARFATHVVAAWDRGASSLRRPLLPLPGTAVTSGTTYGRQVSRTTSAGSLSSRSPL